MDYIPRKENDLRDWAAQALVNLPQIAQDLSLDPNQTRAALQYLNSIVSTYDLAEQKRGELEKAIADKKTAQETALPLLRTFFNGLKSQPNYSDGIGKQLNIVATKAAEIDWDSLKPEPKLSKIADGVKISYKKGKAAGVRIYCRRGSETEFSLVTMHDTSVYLDERPNLNNTAAEKREYYLVFFKNGKNVGLRSDVAIITV